MSTLICALLAGWAAAAEPLNVVIITADTLRADLSMANPEIQTPSLDALAAEGVAFDRAYTNITTTLPSHATLFSSLYPQDHKAYKNTVRVADEVVMLPEILADAGYHTGAIVNMPWLTRKGSNVPQGIQELREQEYKRAEGTTPWALSYLDRRKGSDQPFYLWVHYLDNHTPYHAPGRFERLYYPDGRDPKAGRSGSLQQLWPLLPADSQAYFAEHWLPGVTDADYVVGLYKGSVSWLDSNIGQLVARLKANGQWDHTIFVFTADHGESLIEHGLAFVHSGLYETTTHVPLIMRVPGGPQGKRVATVVDLVDVMPTVLGRLERPVPAGARGEDLWPEAMGSGTTSGVALLEHTGEQLEGVVTARYKYIKHLKTVDWNPGYPIERGRFELYDLQADPGELHNLYDSHKPLAAKLQALITELRAGDRKLDAQAVEVDPETRAMLDALGYQE